MKSEEEKIMFKAFELGLAIIGLSVLYKEMKKRGEND